MEPNSRPIDINEHQIHKNFNRKRSEAKENTHRCRTIPYHRNNVESNPGSGYIHPAISGRKSSAK